MANKTISDLLADFELRHAQKRYANERRRVRSKIIQGIEEEKRALLLKKLECAFLQGEAIARNLQKRWRKSKPI